MNLWNLVADFVLIKHPGYSDIAGDKTQDDLAH